MSLVKVTRESGIPLIGALPFGIIDRGTNLIQVRCTSVCNMRCPFCSTAANDSSVHPTEFIVERQYLVDETRSVVEKKGGDVIIFMDSVGEPTTHPECAEIVADLKSIDGVKEVILITNGTLLTEELISKLEAARLDKMNISFHALDKDMTKKLFGQPFYNVDKVRKMIERITSQGKIKVMLTPVWLVGVNDQEIEGVLQFAKEAKCEVGLQNYEVHKYGRKMKGVKRESYFKFYNKLRTLEKKYDIKLVYNANAFGVHPAPQLEKPIERGERINAEVIADGWGKKQQLVRHKRRVITVKNCEASKGDRINIRITETKHNIYLAEKLK